MFYHKYHWTKKGKEEKETSPRKKKNKKIKEVLKICVISSKPVKIYKIVYKKVDILRKYNIIKVENLKRQIYFPEFSIKYCILST